MSIIWNINKDFCYTDLKWLHHRCKFSSQHALEYFTGNLTYALKSSVYGDPFSLTEVPSITRIVSIDPFLSRAHDKSIWESVLFGMWRMWLCGQPLETRTEPTDSFRRKHKIVISIETPCSNKFILGRFSQNCEKRLLTSSCLSVRLPGLPSGRIFMKFDIWEFLENLSTESNF